MTTFTDIQYVGEKSIANTAIPFIRSREVTFSASGLKPNTIVRPYFDGVDVSEFCRTLTGQYGGQLKTSPSGTMQGVFQIPCNDKIKFRTGDRILRLADSATEPQTYAEATYQAYGVSVLKQRQFTGTRIIERVVRRDPLAQSFFIDLPTGAFITSIDIFFGPEASTNEDSVTVQIRNIDAGLPGNEIAASKTLPATSIVGSNDSFTPVRFKFDAPVFLDSANEYCFVVLSDSEVLTIWTCTLGKNSLQQGDLASATGPIIAKQPFLGSMFKSQNNTTWTPVQEQDIKFVINRAKFASTGVLKMKNQVATSDLYTESNIFFQPLDFDAFQFTSGSRVVRIRHEDHGFKTGDIVYIRKYAESAISTMNGIPVAQLTVAGGLAVTVLNMDEYTVTVATTNATSTGANGGTYNFYCTQNTLFSEGHLETDLTNFADTNTTWSIATKSQATRTLGAEQQFIPLLDTVFQEEKVIASNNTTDLQVTVAMQSALDNLSPIIDLRKAAFISKSNRIDSTGAYAQYIQKMFTLENPANKIQVFLDAYRPSEGTIEVYYKIGQENVVGDWALLPSSFYAAASQDLEDIKENTFELSGLTPFFSVQIKVVFKSTNTAKVPILDSVRTLALMV